MTTNLEAGGAISRYLAENHTLPSLQANKILIATEMNAEIFPTPFLPTFLPFLIATPGRFLLPLSNPQNPRPKIDTIPARSYPPFQGHMDLFEEIVRMRRAGQRGALATIVHTNGSIPSYESSRMLVREDGSMAGTIGGGCVEAEVWAAAKDVIRSEQPRKMTFNLNHEAGYDDGLICGGTLEIFVEPILPQPTLYIFGGGHVSAAARPDRPLRPASPSASWTTASIRQCGALSHGRRNLCTTTKTRSPKARSPEPRAISYRHPRP